MRAVNLIPADQQRGAGGAAGRSGGGVFVLLGALALVVVMASAYVLAGKSVSDKQADLARVTQQAEQAEAHATSLASYTKFAAVRAKRVQTVSQLAAGRFDWAHALREVARVLPENAWLTSLTGTTSPSVSLAGGGASSLRSALPVPAVDIGGCTTSQGSVAKMMARMRLIDGVQRVSLQDSSKGAAGTGGGTGGDDCRGGSSHFPMFKMVVFFAATPATGAAGTQQTAAATTAASTTTPSTTATPSTPTPSSTSSSPAPGGTP